MKRLADRVAIVTGAARGIGEAIAYLFAAEGAAVAVADMDIGRAEGTARRIREAGGRAIAVRCDVGNREDAGRCVEAVVGEFGRLDILVNNAGMSRDAMIHKMTDEQWFDVMRVDLYGVFLMTQLCMATMVKQRYGRIVNISSLAAISGVVGGANYCAAKAGVLGFTKAAAREGARHNIAVNAVIPGPVETDILRSLPEEVRQEKIKPVLMGRAAQPEEIAYSVLFLASEEARFVTAQSLIVDGGRADKL